MLTETPVDCARVDLKPRDDADTFERRMTAPARTHPAWRILSGGVHTITAWLIIRH